MAAKPLVNSAQRQSLMHPKCTSIGFRSVYGSLLFLLPPFSDSFLILSLVQRRDRLQSIFFREVLKLFADLAGQTCPKNLRHWASWNLREKSTLPSSAVGTNEKNWKTVSWSNEGAWGGGANGSVGWQVWEMGRGEEDGGFFDCYFQRLSLSRRIGPQQHKT